MLVFYKQEEWMDGGHDSGGDGALLEAWEIEGPSVPKGLGGASG